MRAATAILVTVVGAECGLERDRHITISFNGCPLLELGSQIGFAHVHSSLGAFQA